MNKPNAIVRPLPPAADTPARRCRIAGSRAQGSAYQHELAALLRYRLRIVTLISLVPLCIFLGRNLIEPDLLHQRGPVGMTLHVAVTMLHAGLAALVWSRAVLCLRTLRGVELLLFGSLAAFFAWLQVAQFRQEALYDAASKVKPFDLVRLAVMSSIVRWFFLIVIYGVFIPNTWKRCALLAGGAAVAATLLTPAAACWFGRFCPDLAYGLLDMAILLGDGVAVAVFGSYRFQVLQQQAFAAQQLGNIGSGSGWVRAAWVRSTWPSTSCCAAPAPSS